MSRYVSNGSEEFKSLDVKDYFNFNGHTYIIKSCDDTVLVDKCASCPIYKLSGISSYGGRYVRRCGHKKYGTIAPPCHNKIFIETKYKEDGLEVNENSDREHIQLKNGLIITYDDNNKISSLRITNDIISVDFDYDENRILIKTVTAHDSDNLDFRNDDEFNDFKDKIIQLLSINVEKNIEL